MDLISALEAAFKVVERLEDRRLAVELYAAARQLNDLFVSPERLARYAKLMRNDTLKLRDTMALAHELETSRPTAARALAHLRRITFDETVVFRPSELAAIRGIGLEKRFVQGEIESLLKAYAWRRAHFHPDFGSPEEAGKLFGFDPKSPPPVSEAELHQRASALEDGAKRLSAALDRAFDHLTSEPLRRTPLRWSHIAAAVVGGLLFFAGAELMGAFLDPYIAPMLDAVRQWLTDTLARST